MTYNLGNFLHELYDTLGQATAYKATGGSTTTAVKSGLDLGDSNLTGAIFVLAADGAAPEGEFSEVTGFNSGTFTFSPAITVAIASGDQFAYAPPSYPLLQMVVECNRGLRKELGDMDLVDVTTLDSVSNQTEYDAELVWKRRTPLRIDIQTNTNDANDNRWVEIAKNDWEFIPATAGAKGLIVFKRQLPADRDLRVWYRDVHPKLTVFGDVVSEMIQPELALASAKVMALKWQWSRSRGSDRSTIELLNEAQVDLVETRAMFPVYKSKRSPLITAIPRGITRRVGGPNKVSL